MKIEHRSLDSISPYPGNPRINAAAVEPVARSIAEFGFNQPIVVDGDGVIVVGHVRYQAAIQLGLETVPVYVAAELTEAQARAYRLVDNTTAEISTWDEQLLPLELSELQALDVDLSSLGFDAMQLDRMLADVGEQLTPADATEAPMPAVFRVVVECADENEQREVFQRLTGEGKTCKLLTL